MCFLLIIPLLTILPVHFHNIKIISLSVQLPHLHPSPPGSSGQLCQALQLENLLIIIPTNEECFPIHCQHFPSVCRDRQVWARQPGQAGEGEVLSSLHTSTATIATGDKDQAIRVKSTAVVSPCVGHVSLLHKP